MSDRGSKRRLLLMAIYSFFSGLGFLDLGFESGGGFELRMVNEIHRPFLDASKYGRAELRQSNSEDVASHCCSIEELSSIRGAFSCFKGDSDHTGFIGGPPCPDFSMAGKQRGREGDNGRLTESYIDLIIEKKPDWFLFENVKGLWRTKKHRVFYDEMVAKLICAGYLVDDRLINALEYGVPQDRDRIILVGFHKRLSQKRAGGRMKEPLPWEDYLTYDKQELFKAPWPTETPFQGNPHLPDGCPKELTVQHWFLKQDVKNHPNYKHGFTPRAALPRFQKIPEGDDSKKSFKRLHRWRYSPTVAYGNNEVHLHPYEARRLRVSESLALQSLPREFSLPEDMSLSNMFKGIGNGVPYLVAVSLAKMIRDHLSKICHEL